MHHFKIDIDKIDKLYYKKFSKKINKIIRSQDLKINKSYQLIIMAAGKGKRMNLNYPKPLFSLNYPYGKNTLIGNILYTLENVEFEISKVNIVINEKDQNYFKNLKFKNSKVKLVKLNNNQINGTGLCLYETLSYLDSDEDLILIWGDLAIFPKSILSTAVLIKENFESGIVFPTKIKKNPYVSFLRNNEGYIDKVLHSNEGNQYVGYAEQDCSCFVISSNNIQDFKNFIEKKHFKNNSEIDFIHFIPYLNLIYKNVVGLPIVSESYVTGVNTINKTKKVQKLLNEFNFTTYSNYFL